MYQDAYNTDMITRDIEKELRYVSEQYPVVTIIGPRQAGKTTLAWMVFPQYAYANLELPDLRRLAQDDPQAFFSAFPSPLIIDEIQHVPSLLSYIQVMVDENQQMAQYILTGSQQFHLHEAVSQSLAGRTALLSLYPLSIKELQQSGFELQRDEFLFQGFYPRIYQDQQEPHRAYRNYYQSYVERDVRQIINVRNMLLFDKFVRLLAGRVGQVINLQSLASDVGVSGTTLNEWLSALEASFIIYRLKPFYDNFGKRSIKSPKLYFTDVGLTCYLLGISELYQISRDPLLGSLFENMVVMEAIKTLNNQGKEPNLYFFRDSKQFEVDLLWQKGTELIPIEIKSAMTYHPDLHQKLDSFAKKVSAKKAYLIYAGELEFNKETIDAVHFSKTAQIFLS